ncbi:MAG TPA: M20/M25/M40 family metallo-hydrolase [Ktedonobacteraceae bacterium]|nr:M20/M25/M40 family metallo-hydrolase [Ktedonobacteraceae bacterium]
MQTNWYDIVWQYTTQLVGIRSVSPGQGENMVAEEVLRLLHAGGLESVYTASGLDPIVGDAYGRQNAYAFLRGESPRTVVLLGHIDTVDTVDYGPLEPWALDPDGLAERQDALAELVPGLTEDLAGYPGDWMLGRGVVDMKSGVAATIAVVRHLAEMAREEPPPLSVVLLATPDEENESAGILQAVRFLLRLREQYGLEYLGALNTDYTSARYVGDQHRYIYTGTAGKLLPSFLVIGRESHVGEPFNGVDANLLAAELVRDLSMNDELCDVVRGQITSPPVTLHASDLKTHYDVQLPFVAYFYLNVLTFSTTPAELLARLCLRAGEVLKHTLQRIDEAERRWIVRGSSDTTRVEQLKARSGTVLTYAELCAGVVQRLGQKRMDDELSAAWESCPDELDARERSLHLVRHLWTLSGKQGPAVVIYYSPPYYPHVAATPSQLHEVVTTLATAHPELNLEVHEYYPYISDMSYLRLDPHMDLTALTDNIPIWQEPGTPARAGSYTLPLAAIQQLGLPVVNLGSYGRGVHQRGERVLMSYSFGVLPQLLYEVIDQLGQLNEESS